MKNKKLIFSLFALVLLIGFVFSAGETTSKTIDVGAAEDIGSLIGGGLIKGTVIAREIEFTKKENENMLTFKEDGRVNIRGNLFENVKELSLIKLNDAGEIIFANLTASENTIFNFDGGIYKVLAGQNILYKNGKVTFDRKVGESIEFKDVSSDIFTKIDFLGEKIEFEKNSEGKTIVRGNFKIGNDEIKGLGKGNLGRVIFSNGKVSEILKGTDATIYNVRHTTPSNNLNIYYDETFDASAHKSGNYFNYGKDKFSLGGTGFTTKFEKDNKLFGNMQSTKVVKGIGTKTRGLEITMNGGNLEISKDASRKDDLTFNVNGNGNFGINNGRTIIQSQGISKIVNGKLTSSGESYLFATANYGEGESYGLSYSYDINFNDGEYKLEKNILTNKNGYIRFNANTEWEDYIRKINERDVNEITKLKEEINGEKGVNARDYAYLLKDREGLVKYFCEARNSANKNTLGVKLSIEELITRYMLEGGASYQSGYPVYVYDNEGLNTEIYGSRIGLDYMGDTNSLKELKKYKLIPEDFQIKRPVEMRNEQHQDTMTAYFYNIKDSITAFAGELTRRKAVFERNCKEEYGEEEFKKMTDDEKYFWLTKYFNSGEGAGKGELTGTKYYTYSAATGEKIIVQGKGKENVYKSWTGSEPGNVNNAHFNAVLSEATYKLFKLSRIFNYV